MGSKIFLVLGLLVAVVLLISMEVAARDLAATSTNRKQNAEEATATNGVDDAKDGGYGNPGRGRYGGGYPGGRGDNGGYPVDDRKGRGGYCRYGCCGSIYGNVCRCCSLRRRGY